jgi:hypothetical protein
MANLFAVVQQLKKERENAQKQVKGIDAALAVLGSLKSLESRQTGERRTMSASARRRIAAAQRARWAKWKEAQRRGKKAA